MLYFCVCGWYMTTGRNLHIYERADMRDPPGATGCTISARATRALGERKEMRHGCFGKEGDAVVGGARTPGGWGFCALLVVCLWKCRCNNAFAWASLRAFHLLDA